MSKPLVHLDREVFTAVLAVLEGRSDLPLSATAGMSSPRRVNDYLAQRLRSAVVHVNGCPGSAEEPFCACGRRRSECDGSRVGCWKRDDNA